tara:strand:+ start:463 stop:690 length:228 start_codon:yes stop_codon:yes gene_type:complete
MHEHHDPNAPEELHRTEPVCACGARTFDSDYALCADCMGAEDAVLSREDFESPYWPILKAAIEADEAARLFYSLP